MLHKSERELASELKLAKIKLTQAAKLAKNVDRVKKKRTIITAS